MATQDDNILDSSYFLETLWTPKCTLLSPQTFKLLSEVLDLVGGGPQGSHIGQLLYIIASNDVIEDMTKEDKCK